jgi:hypothetical protein
MKPRERNYQTATQVKVLSPEIFQRVEAESFHILEGNKTNHEKVRGLFFNRGLSPQCDSESVLAKLGISKYFSQKRRGMTGLKRKESADKYLEVGWLRSKGVTEVMICETNKSHLKGVTLLCRVWREI